jgi:hypothetical protein
MATPGNNYLNRYLLLLESNGRLIFPTLKLHNSALSDHIKNRTLAY